MECTTFPFRLSFVLRQNRLFYYKTLYICTQLFVHTFFQLTTAPDVMWKGPHIHVSSVIFVVSMIIMNVFACPYSFVNITVILVHFYYFLFCFKFYYPIVNIIVNHLYLVFVSVHVKPIQNVVTKTKKTCSDIILA